MKRWIAILCLAALFMGGCSGVILNAEYSMLLDKTAALSAETAERAQAGELSEADKTAALTAQAETWAKFQRARDGEK